MKDPHRKIESLRRQLRRHEYLYYVRAQPQISDSQYDALLRQLKDLEERFPHLRSDDSPTMRVGGAVSQGFAPVAHGERMLSLDNTYSFDELVSWQERLVRILGRPPRLVAELKIDGVSASLTYRRGKLLRAATRGDGERGEDVTANIRTIRAVPLLLREEPYPEEIEIRGEVYMATADFKRLNQERQTEGEELFANPRNAAAGSLKLLDPALVAGRHLQFYAHSLGACQGVSFESQSRFLEQARAWGIRTNEHLRVCATIEQVKEFCQQWQSRRLELAYQIDGVVVKADEIAAQRSLGATQKSPRWAVAYKFPAAQATSEVVAIHLNVGRTGVITPTAEVLPVECAGVTIRHASLHNFDEIRRLGIKKGDTVLIERAGEVIPKIVKVVRSAGGPAVQAPRQCPVCAGAVAKEKEGAVAYSCINPFCPAQLKRRLLHFASRAGMDIEGMGESVIAQLVERGMVASVADIYRLGEQELLTLELFKEKKARNLREAIEQSKTRPLSRLLFALGIRHVGEKAAYLLAQAFRTMEHLIAATPQQLEALDEIGPVVSASVGQFFSQKQTRQLVAALQEAGLSFREPGAAAPRGAPGPLADKTVVFTGALRQLTRAHALELLRWHGGTVASALTGKTDMLVVGENPGSKLEQARARGVRIVNEEEFRALLKE